MRTIRGQSPRARGRALAGVGVREWELMTGVGSRKTETSWMDSMELDCNIS